MKYAITVRITSEVPITPEDVWFNLGEFGECEVVDIFKEKPSPAREPDEI